LAAATGATFEIDFFGEYVRSVQALPEGDLAVELSDEQLAQYREEGFTWVERLTTDAEVEWLRDRMAEVFVPDNENALGGYFDPTRPFGTRTGGEPDIGQSIRPELRMPELLDTIAHRNAVRLATQLLEIDPAQAETWTHMITKPPRHGHDTPWHQDEAFWELDLGYHACGVWLALDDVDVDNGCMQFMPGSHRHGIVSHRHLHDDPMVSVLVIDDVDETRAVPVPLRAGGATFHTQRTMHHTGPNRTDAARRAYAIEVQLPPVRLVEPKVHPWKTL
jgi:ectoine hydroxylase-related dioxygenase (phytanoyl-CoA dioxygenase family)